MAAQTHTIYEFGDFHLEPDERKLVRRGQVIPLHGKAFELLLALIRNRGRLLTKDELFELVWPDQIVEESNLTVNMSAIRRALGERASNPHYITTVSGRGYRFTGEVRQSAHETLTIERETFARVTVEQVETESRTSLAPLVAQVASAIRRIASHPVLFFAACVAVLTIGGASFWVWELHNASAAALPWTNVTPRRFATQGGVPFRVAISPDGKSLAYRQRVNGRDSLWLGQIDSNSSVLISDQPDISYIALAFSPDGASLYLSERDRNQNLTKLVRMPALGGVATELIANVDSAATFSPDGSQLAVLRAIGEKGEKKETSIIIANAADGRNERILAVRKWPESFSSAGISWSPDGKSIAVGVSTTDQQHTEVVAISVADGAISKIGSRVWGVVGNMAWQKDGSGLVVATRETAVARRAQIWFIPYPKGEARKITNDLDVYLTDNLSLSANGTLAILRGHLTSEIRIAPDGDVARSRVVYSGVEPGYEAVDGLAWTADGHLLYSAYVDDSQTIWQVSSDGKDLRRLTNNGPDLVDRQMSATRDGRYIIFHSNRSGSFQIWRANSDGSNLKQLTKGENNLWPSLSPDDKWIVYASERGSQSTLWRISIDGADAVQLTSGSSLRPQVSPDGKYIAYFEALNPAGLRLWVMPLTGGQPLKTFSVPNTVFLTRIGWTPDSGAVVYRDGIQGLWRQRIDEEKPQLARGFEDKEIYQFAWSFDGKNLAYSTGARMQEIILLQDSK
jgi:Tol biopolymer transport system component/DNA-binding winged helix-turn-helix (wHTH) protein